MITFIPLSIKKITTIGNLIQNDYKDIFPYGVHINSASIINNNTLSILTYEKGARRTTQACGTGSIGVNIIAKKLSLIDENINKMNIKNRGGNLIVTEKNNKIYLGGKTFIKEL